MDLYACPVRELRRVGWLRRIALNGASMSHQGIKTGFLFLAERTSSDSVLRPEGIIDTPVFFLEALMVLTGSIAFDHSLPKQSIYYFGKAHR